MLFTLSFEPESRMDTAAKTTDSDLKNRVKLYLNHRTSESTRDLQVEAHGGTVVLQGCVSSLYEKELCRHVCTRVAGVLQVIDETIVRSKKQTQPSLRHTPR